MRACSKKLTKHIHITFYTTLFTRNKLFIRINEVRGLCSLYLSIMGAADDIPQPDVDRLAPLNLCYRVAFCLGHFSNDMFAVVWFAFTQAIYIDVLHISPLNTTLLLMIGQCADILVTPIVGDCIARGRARLSALGWHLAGTAVELVTFPLLYGLCGGGGCAGQLQRTIEWCDVFVYQVPLLVLFHAAYAVTQIAHMAMIAEMTVVRSEREDLFRMSYLIRALGYLAVYTMCYLEFRERIEADLLRLTNAECDQIRMLASIIYALAFGTLLIFYATLYRLDYYARRERAENFAHSSTTTIATVDRPPDLIAPISRHEHLDFPPSQRPTSSLVTNDSKRPPAPIYERHGRRMRPLYTAHPSITAAASLPIVIVRPPEPVNPPVSFWRTPIFYQITLMVTAANCFVFSAMYHIPLWYNNIQRRLPTRMRMMHAAGPAFEGEPHFSLEIAPDDYDTSEQSLIGLLMSSSLVLSVVWLSYLSHLRDHKRTSFLLGTLLGLTLCAWVLRHMHRTASLLEMGLAVVLFGMASGLMMVSALAMVPDLLDAEPGGGTRNHGARVFAYVQLVGKVMLIVSALVM